MTSPVIPAAVTGDGNVKAVFVTAIADTTAPTVAEVTAASAVDLSCYLTGDGLTPSTDEADVTDDRLCSAQTYTDIGKFTDKLGVKYVYRAQDLSSTTNKAQSTLTRGTAGFVVIRWGADATTALAADDVTDVYPVTAGVQMKLPKADNEKLKIQQDLKVTGPVQRDVAIVA